MNIKATAQHLVHEILAMLVGQVLSRIYHSMHVCLHQICYYVYIFITSWRWWLLNIDKSNDIFMVEELEQFYLSHNSFCIYQIFECFWYFLNSNFLLQWMINRWTNNSISSMTYLFDVFIFIFNDKCGSSTLKLSHTFWQFRLDIFLHLFFILLLLLL